MKKLIALLLAVTIMAGVCCFEVSAVPNPDYITGDLDTYGAANDKIYEFNHCYTNAQDDDELIVRVSFTPQGSADEEISQVLYERTGWTLYDYNDYSFRVFVNFEGEDITEAEKLEIKNKVNAYVVLEDELYKQFEEKYGRLFLDSTGLDIEYISNKAIKYREEPVAIGFASIIMCLSKSEINQIYPMDDVREIACHRRKDKIIPPQPEFPVKMDFDEYHVNKQEYLAATDDKLIVADIDLVGEDYDKFFEEMGITPETVGSASAYNDKYLWTYANNIKICLTKPQIYKAAELDCVDNIGISFYDVGWESLFELIKGDVNGDKSLDITDAVNIQKYTVDKTEFSEKQKDLGDYNLDKNCDVLDANAIQVALVSE